MKTVTLLLLCALTFPAQGHRYIRYDKALAADCRHIAKEVAAIEKKQKSKAYSKLKRQLAEQLAKWEYAWHKEKCPRYGPASLSRR
ncbi:hypothetical protein [Gallaecimonas pentaromativorans]|uniref:Uncharacterized protein n=1 Tax=Gallaecimonas pentaromativorans TaxID=584787 RepID=A0A3N1PMR4_9GAMM|nr:hypothetical protein [Gallaecimonas pentaromativorans]MED5524114.1 hypothetical protein [Pseudomonadota bacterium]ROQ29873.1 hypothetical protein EDC28_102248 [Gallaecimonas pentaromativorans]